MHDLVIRNGTVVDGTGGPGAHADVAITDGVVTEVGGVDGTGRVAAHGGDRRRRRARHPRLRRRAHALRRPGDLGPAADAVVLARRDHRGHGQLRRGLRPGGARSSTSGSSVSWRGSRTSPARRCQRGIDWGWETFPEYLDALDARPHVVDIGTQVPHGAVRAYVMGDAGRAQRAGHARRHRGDGRHRARGHRRRARSASRRRAPSPIAPSTASPCRAPSPPRTSCSASAPCSASWAPACSSWPPPVRWARTSPHPSARSTGCAACRGRSAGRSPSRCTQNNADPAPVAPPPRPRRPRPRPTAWRCGRRCTAARCRSSSGSRRSTRSTSPPRGARRRRPRCRGTSRCGASRPSPTSGPGS